MGTNYIAPIWRQPENNNKDRLSNYSIDCDGSNDYITVSDNIFSGLETWSMAGFYNLSTLEADSALFGKYANAPQQILLYWDNPNGWRLLWTGSSTGDFVQLPSIGANEWHFIAVTYDGTTAKMYLDDQVYTYSITTGAIVIDTGAWQIGADGNAGKDFNGKLSQLSFYDYAVGATEIAYLRNGGNPLVISGAEPIAYYPLGDNSNPTATAGYPNIISDADAVFDFDGSTDYIDTPQIDLGVNSSITTWYKPANNSYALFGEATSGFDYLVSQSSGSFVVWMGSSISNIMNFGGAITSNIIFNEWNFLAIVKTGDSVTVYLNNSDGEFSSTVTNVNVAGLSLKFDRIGARTLATPTLYYDGEISNILGFKTSLSSTEVSTVYNNGLPLLELSEIPQKDDLMVWYKLNQSAVLTPGTPTNWTITKIGSPNFSGGNDGSYGGGTSETSPYNSGLIWHDNNSATVGSDYFQWNSPVIYTSGSNIVLSSSGGSWVTPSGGGNQAILEYNIDDGSWVTWHTQTNGIDGFGSNNFTIPSTGNLTVSNNIKIRIKGVDFGSTGSYLKINDINATGGTSSYNEGFTNATRYGFSGGGESQPPATFSADEWDIPDNRSAYPQSFNFDGSEYVDVGNPTELQFSSSFSISCWAKIDDTGSNSIISKDSNFASGAGYHIDFRNGNAVHAWAYDANDKIIATGLSTGVWYNIVFVFESTGGSNGNQSLYINGGTPITNSITSFIASTLKNLRIGNSEVITGYGTNGEISNVQLWDTNLEASEITTLYNNGVPYTGTQPQAANLKGWWKMNVDTSTWDGSDWIIGEAQANYTSALSFNGTTNVALGPTQNSGAGSSSITFSCWMRSTETTVYADTRVPFGSRPNGGGNYTLGRIKSQYATPTELNVELVGSFGTTVLNDGEWHHLVFSWDSSTYEAKAYVDGNTTPEITVTFPSWNHSFTSFGIGWNGFNTVYNFLGNVSNCLYYDKILTSSEVETLYNNGTPEISPSFSPYGWWKCDNLTTGIQDSVGSNNGTNNGATVTDIQVSTLNGISSGMTEANLIDDNVSTVNAESDTLPASALVQSDLTRKLPFSNYSVLFNGVDESFNCGPGFQYTDITVSCWLKFETFTNYDRVYQTGISGGGIGFLLVFLTDEGGNKLNAVWGNPTEESVVSNIDIALDTWYNVLWTRNASEIKMYIDGADVSGGSNVSWGYGSGNDLELGRKPGGGNNFDGDLSNMAIWNSVLTQEEILDVYNNGVPTNLNTSFTPGQPEYWWPMDEDYTYFNGSVLIARDAVGSTDATGVNVIQENIVGNAPGSEANGVGSGLTIADLKGDMQNSTNNSYSINMADYADGVTNPADSGRSTNVP